MIANSFTVTVFLAADALAGTDGVRVFTHTAMTGLGLWLTARLDNLGKGASGAAIQNMNIAMGLDETAGFYHIRHTFEIAPLTQEQADLYPCEARQPLAMWLKAGLVSLR